MTKLALDELHPPSCVLTDAQVWQFQNSLQHAPCLAWMKNGAGDYFYQNKTCEQHFGTGPNEWFGRNDEELHPDDEGRRSCDQDRAVLASDTPLQSLEPRTSVGGLIHTWLMLRFPFIDDRGRRCIGGIGIIVDAASDALPVRYNRLSA